MAPLYHTYNIHEVIYLMPDIVKHVHTDGDVGAFSMHTFNLFIIVGKEDILKNYSHKTLSAFKLSHIKFSKKEDT